MSPVADVLARFVLAVDDRDWQAVTRYLADTVRRDYSSLTGAHGHGRVVGSGVTRRDAGRVRRA